MTRPLPLTWPYLMLFWAVYVWVFVPEFRIMLRATRARVAPTEDRGSLRVVAVGFSIAVLAAFVIAVVVPKAALPGRPEAWFFAGVAVLVSGGLLRRHCFRQLDRFFTGAVTIQADHRVIDSGAYRWVRHPSYTAALMIVLGIALALGNWLGVLAAMTAACPAYAYRARVEEQALLASLGDEYARFMATRKRFVPYVF